MMLLFWLLILVLTAIALAIAILPLLKTKSAQRSWLLMGMILVLLPVSALFLYLMIGQSKAWSQLLQAQAQQKVMAAEIQDMGDIAGIISKLKQRVENSQDPQGWLLLGRLYLKTQKFAEAEVALKHAQQLAPERTDILLAYAAAFYFQHGQTLDQPIQAELEKLVNRDPKQTDALNLLALSYYKQGNLRQALNYWQQLLDQLPANSEEAKMLLQQIALLKQQQQKSAESIQLTVKVDLDESLRTQVSDEDVVFIYAQDPKSSPMPLAVTRRLVKDLPIQVTLDQSMAMVPSMSLANAQQVNIIARISKTGQAIARAGDLIGEKNAVDVRHSPQVIVITINQNLK